MCDLILQNPLAWGQRERGKGKRGIFRLAHHPFERLKRIKIWIFSSVATKNQVFQTLSCTEALILSSVEYLKFQLW